MGRNMGKSWGPAWGERSIGFRRCGAGEEAARLCGSRRWAGLLPCREPRQAREEGGGAGDWWRKAAPGSEHGPRGRVREPAPTILSEATVFRDFQEGTGGGKDRAVGDAPRGMLFIEEVRELLLRNWGPSTYFREAVYHRLHLRHLPSINTRFAHRASPSGKRLMIEEGRPERRARQGKCAQNPRSHCARSWPNWDYCCSPMRRRASRVIADCRRCIAASRSLRVAIIGPPAPRSSNAFISSVMWYNSAFIS